MTPRRPRAAAADPAGDATSAPPVAGPEGGATGAVRMRPETLALSPVYRHLRDAVTRPHLRLTESRYFWERWKPLLGPDAAILVMEVRDRCNRSLAAADGGEGGGDCTVGANELAAACGFSRVTLWRILQREEVRRFVWVEHNYVYDPAMGKRRRTISTYHVLMEDPLVEADEAYVQSLIAGVGTPSLQSATLVDPGSRPVAAPSPRPRLHLGTEVAAPTVQPATTPFAFTVKPGNVQETNLKNRLAGTERGALAPVGDVVKQSSLDDPRAFLAALVGRSVATPTRPVPASPDPAAGARPAPPTGPAPEGGAQAPLRAPDGTRSGKGVRGGIDKYPELVPFVDQAERLLGDRHSRGFYVAALRRLHPDHMPVWHRALGLAAEQPPETIRRSRGALFNGLLRSFAAAAGVTLGTPRAAGG